MDSSPSLIVISKKSLVTKDLSTKIAFERPGSEATQNSVKDL
jgi:hypothetical protein